MVNPEMIAALIKARGEFSPVVKDTKNDFFKSQYATLEGVLAAVTPALLNNGLFLTQPIESDGKDEYLVTRLYYVGGGELESRVRLDPAAWTAVVKTESKEVVKTTKTVPPQGESKIPTTATETVEKTVSGSQLKSDPQKQGGLITYLRRYSVCALLGIAPEDDDGNSLAPAQTATQRPSQTPTATVANRGTNGKPPKPPVPSYDWDDEPHARG